METCAIAKYLAKRWAGPLLAGVVVVIVAAKLAVLLTILSVAGGLGIVIWRLLRLAFFGTHGLCNTFRAWRRRVADWRVQASARIGNPWRALGKAAAVVLATCTAIGGEIVGGAGTAMLVSVAAFGPGDHLGAACLLGAMAGAAVCLGRHSWSRSSSLQCKPSA